MLLTRLLLHKAGWRPRSLPTPGRQWIGKNRRIRPVTKEMRHGQRDKAQRILNVEEMIQFSYLTREEAEVPQEQIDKLDEKKRLIAWQKRTIGPDVFGLGAGKPSPLDHLLVTNTKRYKNKDES